MLQHGDQLGIVYPDYSYSYTVYDTYWYNHTNSNYYCLYRLGLSTESAMCEFASGAYGYDSYNFDSNWPNYQSHDYAAADRLLKKIYHKAQELFGKGNFSIKINNQEWHPSSTDFYLDDKFFKLKRKPIILKTTL